MTDDKIGKDTARDPEREALGPMRGGIRAAAKRAARKVAKKVGQKKTTKKSTAAGSRATKKSREVGVEDGQVCSRQGSHARTQGHTRKDFGRKKQGCCRESRRRRCQDCDGCIQGSHRFGGGLGRRHRCFGECREHAGRGSASRVRTVD